MSSSPEQVARAISSHRFEQAVEQIAPDIVWDTVGQDPLTGRDSVIDACRQLAVHLAETATEFRLFRVIVGEETGGAQSVAIDSLADYTDATGETTTVRSCDIYDFTGGMLTAIASYNLEVAGSPA